MKFKGLEMRRTIMIINTVLPETVLITIRNLISIKNLIANHIG